MNLEEIEDLMDKYILIENDELIKKLYDKIQEYANSNQINEIKKELGSYYLVNLNNRIYHLGKYLKNMEMNYFICHGLENENSLIEIEKVKKLIK